MTEKHTSSLSDSREQTLSENMYGKRYLVHGQKKIIQRIVGARDRTFRERCLTSRYINGKLAHERKLEVS